jgi:hypothetical protein
MKIRKLISLIALFSFCVMAFTGIVMFLAPQSRIAYWSGWELFGLSKRDYDAIHSTFMLLFLTSVVWHTVLNWRPLLDYLKNGSRKLIVFSPELLFAIAISLLFLVGTIWRSAPFDQYLGLGSIAKRYWTASLGSPPWTPADATPLARFCHGMEDVELYTTQRSVTIDCDEAVAALIQAGINVEDPSQPLDDIAAANGTTPRAIAEVVMSVARPAPEATEDSLPE